MRAFNDKLFGAGTPTDAEIKTAAGVNSTDSPTFVTAKLTGLTDGYIPSHTSDAVGLVNSPIYTDGTKVGVGVTPVDRLHVIPTSNSSMASRSEDAIRIGRTAAGRPKLIFDTSNETYANRTWAIELHGPTASVIIGRNGLDAITLDNAGVLGVGVTPTANMAGVVIQAGRLTLKETTTPTADADYGKIYCKSDNKLYFQDGAGTEHEISLVP